MKLLFASGNEHKVSEIRMILPREIELISLKDIGFTDEIPETADTIEGNALLKARFCAEKFGISCFADDTGLEVDALNGAPGVHSARYAGEAKNTETNMNLLLKNLETERNRKAHFKTVIALIFNGEEHLFTGLINGKITEKRKGTNGFGYDPVFQPENSKHTFAEMSAEEKNSLSHRARALQQLVDFLHKKSLD